MHTFAFKQVPSQAETMKQEIQNLVRKEMKHNMKRMMRNVVDEVIRELRIREERGANKQGK